ncbi:hypothetical protein P280DRAFT_76144 [Massarina eburnea CBS 473.64]|uniref:Uncharacterized protein n=1 Tax=Massarina eburnea CBS 473.64 TaxID=1395130 RepID=A0A6A6RTY8_9PLEO|nr:hypothetical protein P280DRAFT_76144 [Massarina eburnea CBS 473.64]
MCPIGTSGSRAKEPDAENGATLCVERRPKKAGRNKPAVIRSRGLLDWAPCLQMRCDARPGIWILFTKVVVWWGGTVVLFRPSGHGRSTSVCACVETFECVLSSTQTNFSLQNQSSKE